MRPSPHLRVALALAATLCLPRFCLSQHSTHKTTTAPKTTKLTNDDIIALTSGGLDDSVIIAKIKSAPATDFDTSVAGLKALKAASVSPNVVRVMIDPSAPAVAPAAPAAPAPVATISAPAPPSPDDPDTVHSPGIYMLAPGKDGKTHLTKLDHISPKQTKSSGAFLSGMTYGITKAHVKVAIDGAKADHETIDTNPVFYAYIPEDNNSFGGTPMSVRDFSLVKLDPKATTREVNTATISPWGVSSGTDEKAKQGFSTDTVKPGVYKLTLVQPLPPGQYAFQTQNYGAFFDFGVLSAQ